MKRPLLVLFLLVRAAWPAAPPFAQETWAYLMKGEERFFPADAPITDLACFSAEVDGDGNLKGGHDVPPSLPGARPGMRRHLVVTMPWNATLAHIYLDPALPLRDRIIANIAARSKPFDGVQIDFESIDARDGTAYLNFLAATRKALPRGKIFSVAVLARWKEHKQRHPDDAFDYPFIGMIADRVIVMAYDEHYRSGPAGPIASLPWCGKIYAYAVETIAAEKLVMGIPLYGRGWQSPALARAYKHREIVGELHARNLRPSEDPQRGGTYRFSETVQVDVHYETAQSIEAKLELYSRHPVRGVAFWRIGQEPEGFWGRIAR